MDCSLHPRLSAFVCGFFAAIISSSVAAHGAPADTSALDEQSALARSQGAVGNLVRDAAFTAADGRTVRLSELRGKPVVVSLVYTSCYHICPATTQHLAKVVRAAREALGPASFTVLSIGFDTPNDTVDAMRAFARQQNVSVDGWEFLSGDPSSIARLSQDLGFRYAASAKGFDHLVQASVLDANGTVYRQVYGVNFETPMLVEPLKELVYAVPPSASLLAQLGNRVKLFCTVYDAATDRYRFDYSLFVGIFIGAVSLGALGFVLVREWVRPGSGAA